MKPDIETDFTSLSFQDIYIYISSWIWFTFIYTYTYIPQQKPRRKQNEISQYRIPKICYYFSCFDHPIISTVIPMVIT